MIGRGPDREKRVTKAELADADHVLAHRPTRRRDCPKNYVPCPYVSCRHHLWTDCTAAGRIVRSKAWGNIRATCSLRYADVGAMLGCDVADVMGLTRRQIVTIELTARRTVLGRLTSAPIGSSERLTR